ncbi:hypothetical protein EHS86_00115 [Erwinia amylovora]|nr:hypothetical protein AD997_06860 [Erwinia amylovora]RWS40408.1 hypothetical protein EHS86_00115 [Erwinia amylovora]
MITGAVAVMSFSFRWDAQAAGAQGNIDAHYTSHNPGCNRALALSARLAGGSAVTYASWLMRAN